MKKTIKHLPALLENQLQDIAQMFEGINYSDIDKFSKRSMKDIDKAYYLIVELDKKGFFEIDTNPEEYVEYIKLIKLIKNK